LVYANKFWKQQKACSFNQAIMDLIQSKPISCSEKNILFVAHVLEQPAEQRAMIRLANQEISQLSAISRKKFGKII